MERAAWIREQLEAWGYRGVSVTAPEDKRIYLKKEVGETLTAEQLAILRIEPVDDNLFNTPRHQVEGKAFKAFRY